MPNKDLHDLANMLPVDVIRRIERGHPVTLVVTRDGDCLTAHEVDPEQAWFWTAKWQQGEREAADDIAAGRIARYESDEAFLAGLEADLKPLPE